MLIFFISSQMVAPVVYSILYGGIKSTFFKYNLHAGKLKIEC